MLTWEPKVFPEWKQYPQYELWFQSIMLIKQPTLAVERKEGKREEGYKGLHSGLTITGLTITHELWQRQIRTEHTKGCSNS